MGRGEKREGERGEFLHTERRVEAATLKVFPNMSDNERAFRSASRSKSKIKLGRKEAPRPGRVGKVQGPLCVGIRASQVPQTKDMSDGSWHSVECLPDGHATSGTIHGITERRASRRPRAGQIPWPAVCSGTPRLPIRKNR